MLKFEKERSRGILSILFGLSIMIFNIPLALSYPYTVHTYTIEVNDLRKTKPGKTLKRLNEKIRQKVKSANKHSADNLDSKIDLLEKAKIIKSSDEYQEAVAILKPLRGKKLSCYGSLCSSESWKRDAIERLLVNPNFLHCYYSSRGYMRCSSQVPNPNLLYSSQTHKKIEEETQFKKGANQKTTKNTNNKPSKTYSWRELGCPQPYPNRYGNKPNKNLLKSEYIACLDEGICKMIDCVKCNSLTSSDSGNWSSVSMNLCN